MTPSPASPQPVGAPITWTATAVDGEAGSLDYQFSVADSSGVYQVVQDYSELTTFTWAPSTSEGSFSMQVVARNKTAGETAQAQGPYTVVSRVSGTTPVITLTANPLVALYSAPACAAGSTMYVVFALGKVQTSTSSQNCNGLTSMNFYIGGMGQSSKYVMHYVLTTGSQQTVGPNQPFTTGAIPAGLLFPSEKVQIAEEAPEPSGQNVLLIDHMGPFGKAANTGAYMPTAYNLKGDIIWYYTGLAAVAQNGAFYIRPVPGGTFMLHANDPNSQWVTSQIWREIDLAGNTIRQTNATRVNEQINAQGYLGCTSFTHDAIRLPNGHTLILCTQEQIFPPGTQGAPAQVDIAGDGIVDLDTNLQLAWYWSAYDNLDINRAAILNEKIVTGETFQPLLLAPIANDWLHSNSLNYVPSDGSVVVSLRHQDWVAKVNYQDGAGDGSVVWLLGQDGSFAINSPDPYPWFTHQHDVEYELNGTQILSLYDNGNTRVAQNPGIVEHSRGTVLSLDYVNMIATPVLLADMGAYSSAGGSAQRLDNGNYHFDSALLGTKAARLAQHIEVAPIAGQTTATTQFLLQSGTSDYRSYRMISLYQLD